MMNKIYQPLQFTDIGPYVLETLILPVISLGRACSEAASDVAGNKERGTLLAEILLKVEEKNAYTSQIEIAEVDIMVRYGAEPSSQVGRLRISGHKEHFRGKPVRMKVFFKECPLPTYHPEILHILNTHHDHVLRYGEPLPFGDKQETAFLRIHRKRLSAKGALHRLLAVHRESRARPHGDKLGVSCHGSH